MAKLRSREIFLRSVSITVCVVLLLSSISVAALVGKRISDENIPENRIS